MLDILNESVIKKIRESIDLPFDENVYLDLKQRHGRTYEAGIILNIELDHITFNDFVYHIMDNWHFDKISGFPKIVFKKNIFSYEEIKISPKGIKKLRQLFSDTVEYKNKLVKYEKELCTFEGDDYKIRINNSYYTVLKKNKNSSYDLILDKCYLGSLNINDLKDAIDKKIIENDEITFLEYIKKNKYYQGLLDELKNYNGIKSNVEIGYKNYEKTGLYISLWLYGQKITSQKISPDENDLNTVINQYKNEIDVFFNKYRLVYDVINRINNCSNKLWKAEFYVDYCRDFCLKIIIQADRWHDDYYIDLTEINIFDNEQLINTVTHIMNSLLREMEIYGHRIIWISEEKNEK